MAPAMMKLLLAAALVARAADATAATGCLWMMANVSVPAAPAVVSARRLPAPLRHGRRHLQHCLNSEGGAKAVGVDAQLEVWCRTAEATQLVSAYRRAGKLVAFRVPWSEEEGSQCRALGFRRRKVAPRPSHTHGPDGKPVMLPPPPAGRADASLAEPGVTWVDVDPAWGGARRGAGPLQLTPQDVKFDVIQEVGPVDTQITVTFVSAGYTKDEQEKFEADVQRGWQTLDGTGIDVGVLDSAPWPRYYPTINVYSIFQESKESGASMPHGPGHVQPKERYCNGEKGCEPFEVTDNLGCAYGSPHQKMLNCDWGRVLELASFAPSSDLVVVFVNADVYGGTGDPGPPNVAPEERVGVAMLYNGESMPLLLVHEVGHAFGGLSDEYSYGVAEPSDLGLINCSPDKNKFAAWAALGEADPNALQPCSYTNYYRPTKNRCLMGAVYHKMCAVCKEGMVQAMYKKPIDLTQPRCPLEDELVQLAPDDEITLRINEAFATQDAVEVRWHVPVGFLHKYNDYELTRASLPVKGSYLVPGEHVLKVTVADKTGMVLSHTDDMTIEAKFFITRVIDGFAKQASLCTERACKGTGYTDPDYCSVCKPGGVCNVTRVITPKERVVDVGEAIGMARGTVVMMGVLILVGILAIGGIFVFGITKYRETRVQEVVILKPVMRRLRYGLLYFGALLVVTSIFVFCSSAYYFEQSELFGQGIIIVGMILSAFMFVVCACLAVAAFLKITWLLFCTMVMLTIIGIFAFAAGAFALYVAHNLNTPSIRDSLQAEWDLKVASHPEVVCTFQKAFDCSGFLKSCASLGGSKLPAFCPAACELANRKSDSCFARLEVFVEGNFLPFGGVMITAGVGFLFAGVAALLLATAIISRRQEMQRRRRRRLRGMEGLQLDSSSSEDESGSDDERTKHQPLTNDEITALTVEFKKVDKDGSGALDKDEAFEFWSVALNERPTEKDISRASTVADANGDGRISFDEFLALYQPYDHRSSVPQAHNEYQRAPMDDPQISGEITPGEVGYLKRQFQRVDRGTETIASRPQLRAWFQTLYRRPPLDDELDAFFRKMDPKREGKVSFDGFAIPYRELRKKKAAMLNSILGVEELRALRVLFVGVNLGNDSLLQTREEFTAFYREFHEADGNDAQVAEFTKQVVANSEGVVGFLDFCVPFARRVQRRSKMRAGLDDERVQLIRDRYQNLEKTPDGALTVSAVRELYIVLYDNEPSAEGLRLFVQELDLENNGTVTFDELLRLFAETTRATTAKLWLQGKGVTEAEADLSQTDFLALSKVDAGLRIGVSKDAFAALVRNVARHLSIRPPTTTALNEMFLSFDEDGDEYLDEMEFTKAHYACVISAMHASGCSSAQLQLTHPPPPNHPSQSQPAVDVLSPGEDSTQRNPLLGDLDTAP
eukprot:TRINITY_DN8445_c0_g1_i1.p1 TRINITY_DN8445_c0_g1~~TRINITY_DN8445_c0_g1_i1.p1  ORF type:complete len:1403 (+),score=520.35 TRINITY_DN8445_c0_g1_i1:105-4313(+)